jgi:hypothetical protein
MPTKIDFNTWAGLQNGRIAYIAEGGLQDPKLSYHRGRDEFEMTKYVNGDKTIHVLNGLNTDVERLNKHWQEFAKA